MNAMVIVSALAWGGCVASFLYDTGMSFLKWRLPRALSEPVGTPVKGWVTTLRRLLERTFRGEDLLLQIEEVAIALAFQMKAGANVYGAVSEVSRGGKGLVYSKLAQAAELYATGLPVLDALDRALSEPGIPELSHLLAALQIGLLTGGNIPLLLTRAAEACRRKRAFRREVSAKLAESRMTAILLSSLPWLVLLLTGRFEPGLLPGLLEHPAGKLMALLSLIMWLLGVFVVGKLVRSVVPREDPFFSGRHRLPADTKQGRGR